MAAWVGITNRGTYACHVCGKDMQPGTKIFYSASLKRGVHPECKPEAITEKFWDSEELIGECQKTQAIKYIVSGTSKDTKKYVVVREFYTKDKGKTWLPNGKGLSIELSGMEPLMNLMVAAYAFMAESHLGASGAEPTTDDETAEVCV